jgi:hypothetical protein
VTTCSFVYTVYTVHKFSVHLCSVHFSCSSWSVLLNSFYCSFHVSLCSICPPSPPVADGQSGSEDCCAVLFCSPLSWAVLFRSVLFCSVLFCWNERQCALFQGVLTFQTYLLLYQDAIFVSWRKTPVPISEATCYPETPKNDGLFISMY